MRIGVLYYIMHEVRWQHEIIMCCIVIVSCQTLIAFKVFFLQVAIYKLIAYTAIYKLIAFKHSLHFYYCMKHLIHGICIFYFFVSRTTQESCVIKLRRKIVQGEIKRPLQVLTR